MAASLKNSDIGVRVDVVGFDIAVEATRNLLRKLADAGSGSYIDAASPEDLQKSLKDKMSVPIELLAQDGAVISRGYLGDSIEVPEGKYTLRLVARVPFTVADVPVTATKTTEVRLDLEGAEITSEILLPR